MSKWKSLTLLPQLEVSPSGCSQSPCAAVWTSPNRSSTSSASLSVAAVLGWNIFKSNGLKEKKQNGSASRLPTCIQEAMLQCGRKNWRSKSCGRSRWLLSYLESLSSFQHYLEFVKMRNSRANGTFRHFKPASILGCSRCDSCGGSGRVRPQ